MFLKIFETASFYYLRAFSFFMTKYAIIVAGGKGTRMKSGVPKQFLLLNGKPVLFHTLECFYHFDPLLKIILVLPRKHFSYWKKLCARYKFSLPHAMVAGGSERFFSVKNGLGLVKEKGIVAVHDGVRPLANKVTLKKCFDAAAKKGNAIPVIPITESLRQKKKKGSVRVNRQEFFIVQTPQCFDSEILKKAYRQKYSAEFTDDASVVEKSGIKIVLTEGNPENIKITSPADLKIAELLEKSATRKKPR